jgi:hypothetical protein
MNFKKKNLEMEMKKEYLKEFDAFGKNRQLRVRFCAKRGTKNL